MSASMSAAGILFQRSNSDDLLRVAPVSSARSDRTSRWQAGTRPGSSPARCDGKRVLSDLHHKLGIGLSVLDLKRRIIALMALGDLACRRQHSV